MTPQSDLQTAEMTGAEREADPTLGISHRTEDSQNTETNNLGKMDIKKGTMTINRNNRFSEEKNRDATMQQGCQM